VSLGTITTLACATMIVRMVRRGEAVVLSA
jgi:hypothetical protein